MARLQHQPLCHVGQIRERVCHCLLLRHDFLGRGADLARRIERQADFLSHKPQHVAVEDRYRVPGQWHRKPAAVKQPMTKSRWLRVAGPGEVQALIPMAHGCRASTLRVESALVCPGWRHYRFGGDGPRDADDGSSTRPARRLSGAHGPVDCCLFRNHSRRWSGTPNSPIRIARRLAI